MFERFTKAAREAVVQAQAEARAVEHGHIGTEHLLLALLESEDDSGPLHRAGVDRERAEIDLARALESLTPGPAAGEATTGS
jgi:ATP-dependent Clp protease ATP-binding subunit ClpA